MEKNDNDFRQEKYSSLSLQLTCSEEMPYFYKKLYFSVISTLSRVGPEGGCVTYSAFFNSFFAIKYTKALGTSQFFKLNVLL